MNLLQFLRENARWVAGGFLLTFFSSFGQTFFISLSAGQIREEFGLSHGGFGGLYMGATLLSALTLPRLGRLVDHHPVAKVTLITMPALAAACIGMALSPSLVVLFVSIYALRLFGQGMMSHIAYTAMGKWYVAQRGRAVSFASVGVNFGEALLPAAFVALALSIGWRNAWLAGAAVLLLAGLPAIRALMAVEREPRTADSGHKQAFQRDWTLREAAGDPLFYAMLAGVLAPPFIGTTIFFHQVYLVELRGWSPQAFAASFAAMSVMTVVFSLICGQMIDRFTAARLLPAFLAPLAAACAVLAHFEAQWSAFAFMGLLGISYGFSNTLFGALWPEVYGAKHLGAIRSAIVPVMVFMTALGPGVTGYLIDAGVSYPAQIFAMGVYCLAAMAMLILVSRRLQARAATQFPSKVNP